MKMQKNQLALVAAAFLAGPALAQGLTAPKLTWNFIGEFDVGIRNTKHDDPSQSRTALTNSNAMTTLLIGGLTMDFGNDFKGIAMVEIDHDATNSNKTNQAVGTNIFTGSPFQGQQYVGLATKFGTVKLGIPNSWGLSTAVTSTPFGTGQSSGYHSGTPFARLGSLGVSGVTNHIGNGAGRVIRHERTMTYETPNFGGLSAQLEFSPENDNAADGSASNNNRWLGIGGRFARPNFTIMAFHGEGKAGANRASGTTPPSATAQVPNVLAAGQSVRWNLIGANYKVLPTATIYGGWTQTRTSNDVERSQSWNIAGKYTIQEWDLMANYLVRTANEGAGTAAAARVPKGRLIGLGVDYRFDGSGLNAVYWRHENVDKVDALGRSLRTNTIGVRVGFNI